MSPAALEEANANAKSSQTIESEATEEKESLKAEIAAQTAEVTMLRKKVSDLKDDLDSLDADNSRLEASKAKLSLELQQARGADRVAQLEKSIERLKGQLVEEGDKAAAELSSEMAAKAKVTKVREGLIMCGCVCDSDSCNRSLKSSRLFTARCSRHLLRLMLWKLN